MTAIPAELLCLQHAQIDDLLDFAAMLRDPDALTELADTLAAHLALEHEVVYPALAGRLSAEVLEELAAEQAEIKRALARLVWCGVEDPDFAVYLGRLRDLMDGHVAYQEECLFSDMLRADLPQACAAAHAP